MQIHPNERPRPPKAIQHAESVAGREALRERLGQRWDWLQANTCTPYHSGWMDALEWVRELLLDVGERCEACEHAAGSGYLCDDHEAEHSDGSK